MTSSCDVPLGAVCTSGNACSFLLWAPKAEKVDLHLISPDERRLPMQVLGHGYFHSLVEDVGPGTLYRYRLNGQDEYSDPASRFQPEGVHGPSQVVENRFDWSDPSWPGMALDGCVLYELHVGTFAAEGTFDAIIPRVAELKDLGITAIEIMPVAQFPGRRNWGYDGVYPYAVQNSYGGPAGLKRLVDACHRQEMAVVLDVVYNHLGPEGNYVGNFGFYFTDAYKTPWGPALNFAQEYSDEVRRYFIENALQWITDFHIDGLRLDATHAIIDPSARPFIEELGEACHKRAEELDRQVQIIAESNRNDSRIVIPRQRNGWGLDSQWNDDFHHSLRVALTAERSGYYQDFVGVEDLARAFREGFVYSGQYSKFRKCRHGNSSRELPAETFVVFDQNHDQVGNRKLGDRLATAISFEQLKLAAAALLLSPYVPLLFMGEEYGEPAPFQYFVSHGDVGVVESVRKGRSEEFTTFGWVGDLPDPQSEETFLRSRLNWDLRKEEQHRTLLDFYRELLRIRREKPALARLDKNSQVVALFRSQKIMAVRRQAAKSEILAAFNFAEAGAAALINIDLRPGRWVHVLDSADERWRGPRSEKPATSLESTGSLQLELRPSSVQVYEFSETAAE